MGDVVYAKYDSRVVWSQGISPLTAGDVWDSEADLVKERPELFAAEPTRVKGRKPRRARPPEPEQAEQAEGQAAKRSARRRPSGGE